MLVVLAFAGCEPAGEAPPPPAQEIVARQDGPFPLVADRPPPVFDLAERGTPRGSRIGFRLSTAPSVEVRFTVEENRAVVAHVTEARDVAPCGVADLILGEPALPNQVTLDVRGLDLASREARFCPEEPAEPIEVPLPPASPGTWSAFTLRHGRALDQWAIWTDEAHVEIYRTAVFDAYDRTGGASRWLPYALAVPSGGEVLPTRAGAPWSVRFEPDGEVPSAGPEEAAPVLAAVLDRCAADPELGTLLSGQVALVERHGHVDLQPALPEVTARIERCVALTLAEDPAPVRVIGRFAAFRDP